MIGKGIFDQGINFQSRFIPDCEELAQKIAAIRSLGYLLVMTQGGYDIAHVGHQRYLDLARDEGEKLAQEKGLAGCVLLVAIDSDQGLHLRKSTSTSRRPIVPEMERAEIVAGFKPVNLVTIDRDCFPAGHPRKGHSRFSLVCQLQPELFIASQGSYTEEHLKVIKEHAGEIRHLPEQATGSTTAIVRRIHMEKEAEIQQKVAASNQQTIQELEQIVRTLSERIEALRLQTATGEKPS